MKKLLILLLLHINALIGEELNKIKYEYVLPELPYAYKDLEPYIDAQTMKLHYTKHHQAYIDKLNKALNDKPELQKKTLEELLINIDEIKDKETQKEVRNNGGGHWNHSFFWKIMKKPSGKNAPTKLIADLIKKSFGSFETFKELFNAEAKKVFGSGWAWLSLDKNNKLIIHSSSNQDSPLSSGLKPILGLDVWEHAYYLKYKNERPEYINAWWNVINWDQVENNYKN